MTTLLHPCPGARVSQRFGENPFRFGYGADGHQGEDYGVVVGTPLRAPIGGHLIVGKAPSTYGLYVLIRAGAWSALLAHLSEVCVRGDVTAGETVALSGNSGKSTAPHVHLGFMVNGVWVDPALYLEGNMTPSKITWHVQSLWRCPWLKDVLADSPIEWIKLMDPPEEDECPVDPRRVKVDGRPWIGGDDVEMDQYIMRGQEGAEAYYERCREAYERAPYVYAWEGPNEPFMGDPHKRSKYVAFMIALANIMHRHGQRIVGGSIAVGWPDWPDVNDLIPMAKEMDLMGYHGYSAPLMSDRHADHTLRYRGIVARWADAGFDSPPWILSEAGIDGGVAPLHAARTGWRTWARGWQAYMPQLVWLDKELAKDDLVEAAMVYTLGAERDWLDFQLDRPHVEEFTAYQRSIAAPAREPLPMDETATDPAMLADKCRWWMEEMKRVREDGRHDRADQIHESLIGLHYRLEEALKHGR